MSPDAHIGTGLFASAFGVIFGGMPLAMFIFVMLEEGDAIEKVLVGLFVSPFVLIGGSMFIFGVVCVGAGIIGYPLIKEYDDEDEEEADGHRCQRPLLTPAKTRCSNKFVRLKSSLPLLNRARRHQPSDGAWRTSPSRPLR